MTSAAPEALASAVGPLPEGARLPMRPVFGTVEEERQYRKEQLAAAFRLFGTFGFSEGVASHIGHIAGWVQAQPLFDQITAAGPGHRA